MNRRVLIIVLVILVLGIIGIGAYIFLRPQAANPTGKVTITYWGLWDDASVYKDLFTEYEVANSNVKIEYIQKSLTRDLNNNLSYKGLYQTTVDERLKSGGIDIIRVHNSWIPRIIVSLAPAPKTLFSEQKVKEDYYPAIYEAITSTNGNVYGAPQIIDGLVLFYNKTLFAEKKIAAPPKNWDEMVTISKALTKVNGTTITQAGINLGSGSNSVTAFENALLMMTQANVPLVTTSTTGIKASFATSEATAAINSFFSYSKIHNSWSNRLVTDLDLFTEGKLAMMIAPSWRANDVFAANATLDFDITTVPVLPGANRDTPQYLASYWIDVVPKVSKNSTEAWKLLAWLSQPEQLRKINAAQSKIRLFGAPYPLTSMKSELANTPYSKTILEMAPSMKSWPLYDYGAWELSFKEKLTEWEVKSVVTINDLETLQEDLNKTVFK